MAGLTIASAPAAEPISTADARAHCRVDDTTDDTYLDALVKAARIYCEDFTGRAFITQTWDLTLDSFPYDGVIRLPKSPLSSVTSITYTDTNGDTQTLSAALYQVDNKSEPGRIIPAYGESWPSIRPQLNTVTVRFICGYGAAGTNVPATLIHAMKLIVGHWYENREQVVTGTIAAALPMAAENLLWSERLSGVI